MVAEKTDTPKRGQRTSVGTISLHSGAIEREPGDDGATSLRNGDLKKRLRVGVSRPKLEEDFELDAS